MRACCVDGRDRGLDVNFNPGMWVYLYKYSKISYSAGGLWEGWLHAEVTVHGSGLEHGACCKLRSDN